MPCTAVETCRYRRTQEKIKKRGLFPALGESRFRVIAVFSSNPKDAACEAPGREDFAFCSNLEATEIICDVSPDYVKPA